MSGLQLSMFETAHDPDQALVVAAAAVTDEPAVTLGNHSPADDSIAAGPSTGVELYRPPSGATARVRANLAALEVLDAVADDELDDDQRAALGAWSSWGAVPGVFDSSHKTLGRFGSDVAAALGSREAQLAARRTVLNAHYTSTEVAGFMWELLAAGGISGGTAVEPGCGNGVFIAAAPDTFTVTGVEADPTTARIAALLHPHARIEPVELQRWKAAHRFDAAIGNVPFSDVAPFDARLSPKRRLALHNYALLRGLEALRPGGLLVCLTSMWTMDAKRSHSRRELSRYGRFVTALRLPNDALKACAGTAAVTDLVVLQRRPTTIEDLDEADLRHSEQLWLGTSEVEGWTINDWYAQHPELMLGTLSASRMYGGEGHSLSPLPDRGPLVDQLRAAADLRVVADAVESARDAAQEGARSQRPGPIGGDADRSRLPRRDDAAGRSQQGTIVVDGQGFLVLRDGMFVPFQRPPRSADPEGSAAELRALIGLRDARLRLMDLEADPHGDPEAIQAARAALRDAYDVHQRGGWGHVARVPRRANGHLKPWRASGFVTDPHYQLVRSLEDRAKIEAGEHDVRGSILFRRAVGRPKPVETTVATVGDAVALSMARTGAVWVDEVSRALGREVTAESLAPFAFVDPATGQLEPAARYLSGNVRAKLADAQLALDAGEPTEANIEALTEVLPEWVGPDDIEVELGVPWVTPEEVEQFARQLLGCDALSVVRPVSQWTVRVHGIAPVPALRTQRWGTDAINAETMLERLLNRRRLVSYTEDAATGRDVVDTQTTMRNYEIAQAWQAEFARWCFDSDPARCETLTERFNLEYSGWVVPNYEPWPRPVGLAEGTELLAHQARTLARIIHEGHLLAGHEVGLGKTLIMCSAAMEMRRLGMAVKPMMVVPDNLVDQAAEEFHKFFPAAQLLVFSREGSVARNDRELFAAQVASGDFDTVIVSYSAFGAMPISATHAVAEQADYLRSLSERHDDWLIAEQNPAARAQLTKDIKRATRRLAETMTPLHGNQATLKKLDAAALGELAEGTVKQAERARLARQERFREHDSVHTGVLSFEDLGVDFLLVDELHLFKNLAVESTSELLGRSRGGSRRATDLDRKLRWLRDRHDGKSRIVGATGTPVSNSLHEMWVMQRYCQPALLERLGLAHIDAWLATFAGEVTQPEVSVIGEWDMRTRVATYRNLPELLRIAGQNIELLSYEQAGVARPAVAGGDPTVIEVPASAELQAFIDELAEREQSLGDVAPEQDNMLSICNDARSAALHLGLVGHEQPTPSKFDYAAAEIVRVWQRWSDHHFETADGVTHRAPGCLQLVFCDLGTPTGNAQINTYQTLRDALADAGMDPERVRFFHDRGNTATRRKTFDDACRNGAVDVVIASTAKAGVGWNVQQRLAALHHMDCPWKPAEVVQREGRALRQGNAFDEVEILRYVSIGSFDTFSWQVLETKQGFISMLTSLAPGQRRIAELDSDMRASFANVKAIAAGDPRLLRIMELERRESQLRSSQRSHDAGVRRSRSELGRRRDELARTVASIAKLEALPSAPADVAAVQLRRPNDTLFDDNPDRELRWRVTAALRGDAPEMIATMNGVGVWVRPGIFGSPVADIGEPHSPLNAVLGERDDLNRTRVSQRIANLWRRRGETLDGLVDYAPQLEAEIAVLESEIDREWPHHDELRTVSTERAQLAEEVYGRQPQSHAQVDDVTEEDAVERPAPSMSR